MNLLALDQASDTGWAAWVDGRYRSGVWRFPASKFYIDPVTKEVDNGARWMAVMRKLTALHKECHFDYVAYEGQFVGKNLNAVRTTHGLMAIIEIFCAAKGLPPAIEFAPDAWRSKVYGPGKVKAPRRPKDMSEAEKTRLNKQFHIEHAYELCAELGLDITRPDEAEAVGILEALKIELAPAHANANHERLTGQGALL